MNYNILIEEPILYAEKINQVKYECKCGHKVIIPYGVKRQLCSYCKNYVYKDKKLEFKAKFKQYLKSKKVKGMENDI